MKQPLSTTCPACSCRIQLDPESGEVLSHEPAPESLDAALKRAEADDESNMDNAFQAAVRAERDRSKALDDAFRDASDKLSERDDDSGADNPLDERWR